MYTCSDIGIYWYVLKFKSWEIYNYMISKINILFYKLWYAIFSWCFILQQIYFLICDSFIINHLNLTNKLNKLKSAIWKINLFFQGKVIRISLLLWFTALIRFIISFIQLNWKKWKQKIIAALFGFFSPLLKCMPQLMVITTWV